MKVDKSDDLKEREQWVVQAKKEMRDISRGTRIRNICKYQCQNQLLVFTSSI